MPANYNKLFRKCHKNRFIWQWCVNWKQISILIIFASRFFTSKKTHFVGIETDVVLSHKCSPYHSFELHIVNVLRSIFSKHFLSSPFLCATSASFSAALATHLFLLFFKCLRQSRWSWVHFFYLCSSTTIIFNDSNWFWRLQLVFLVVVLIHSFHSAWCFQRRTILFNNKNVLKWENSSFFCIFNIF